jgi:hypothetical protein
MRQRTQMLALMLTAACCSATLAADRTAVQGTMIAQVRAPIEPAPLEQQVIALQKQVSVLQAQLNALLSAVKVSEAGVVLQGRTVSIAGATIDVRSDGTLAMRAANLAAEVARDTSLRSGFATSISSSAGVTVQAAGPVDIRGTQVRLNGGSRPVATVGSGVQTSSAGSGQVITGSSTVLAD